MPGAEKLVKLERKWKGGIIINFDDIIDEESQLIHINKICQKKKPSLK